MNIQVDASGDDLIEVCPRCKNLATCICSIAEKHKLGCTYRRAALLSIELPCDHGFQACPICDPCSCDLATQASIKGIL